jgi:GNAT superfamily N-acetyltransferase
MTIREIDPNSVAEIELVAVRMRDTLVEVLGEATGRDMYSLDWLVARVRWHLDPLECSGAVFLAVLEQEILGHTLVRLEPDDDGTHFGLFTTFFVAPAARNQSVAKELVKHGENWMRGNGMLISRTYTAENNIKLHNLMFQNGYEITLRKSNMVVLSKVL